jgi:hypothetical protein
MTTQKIASSTLVATQTWLVTWNALANGDVGQAWELNECADNNFSVDGTFGSGGSITLKGSMNGTSYYALHDQLGMPSR